MTYTKEDYLKDVFENTIENEEWELYLLFSLLYYMYGNSKKWKKNYGFTNMFNEKKDVISFKWITPKWWSYNTTYTYLFFIFKKLDIKVDTNYSKNNIEEFFNTLNEKGDKKTIWVYETDNHLVDRFLNKEETTLLFEEPLFFYLEGGFLEWCEIINDFGTEENIEKILELIDAKINNFVDWWLEKEYGVLSFNKQKELLLNNIAKLHNFYWTNFQIKESEFWEEWEGNKFTYIHFFVFLFRYEYIKIDKFSSVEEDPLLGNKWVYIWENEKYSFHIFIKPKLENLIKWWFKLKELILEKIFDEEYKQITIKKKKSWELHLLEWNLEFIWDDNKQVELKKRYPHSDITSKNYEWITNKYEVIEKTRLDIKEE